MHTPVLLHVLQPVWPEPRNRPVPLQVLQRPEPPQEIQADRWFEEPSAPELYEPPEPARQPPSERVNAASKAQCIKDLTINRFGFISFS